MENFYLNFKNIDNLEDKLSGKLPVNRDELIALINTHGRTSSYLYIKSEKYNKDMRIQNNELELTYLPLENLDVSQIKNFNEVFMNSLYNGDLSKWDFSNAQSFKGMFAYSKFNNNSLKNFNFKNIKDAICMFTDSKFCGDISGWINYENTNLLHMFSFNKDFQTKYCFDNKIESYKVKQWLDENLERIREINRPKDEFVLDYFDFDR